MTMAPGQPEAQPDAHVDLSATDGAVAIKGRTPWQIVVSRLRRDKVTMVAGIIIWPVPAGGADLPDAGRAGDHRPLTFTNPSW